MNVVYIKLDIFYAFLKDVRFNEFNRDIYRLSVIGNIKTNGSEHVPIWKTTTQGLKANVASSLLGTNPLSHSFQLIFLPYNINQWQEGLEIPLSRIKEGLQ